jgi:hypothetical protein
VDIVLPRTNTRGETVLAIDLALEDKGTKELTDIILFSCFHSIQY